MKQFCKYLCLLPALCLMLASCDDIFEKDLDGKVVTLTAPQNNYQTEVLTHTFWWEEVDGALKYNLQIVSPSFTNVEELILDTNVSATQYQYTLHPGTFQWRVRAYNGSSTTLYTTYTLTIDSSANLSTQQVVLMTPSNNHATVQTTLTFKWYELYNADDYRFEIKTPDWDGELVYNPEIVEGTELTLTLDEGSYVWGVQAQNSSSSSVFSTRALIIDSTDPATPQLLSPANGDTVTAASVYFSWERGSNSGSAITDSLYIASDTSFATIKVNVLLSDTTYTWSSVQNGTYYWHVKSIDAAGNESGYSSRRKFIYSTSKK